MRYTYSADTGSLYLYVRDSQPVARTVEISPNCLVDVDATGDPIGIEVVNLAFEVPIEELISRFRLEALRSELESLPKPNVTSGPAAVLVA